MGANFRLRLKKSPRPSPCAKAQWKAPARFSQVDGTSCVRMGAGVQGFLDLCEKILLLNGKPRGRHNPPQVEFYTPERATKSSNSKFFFFLPFLHKCQKGKIYVSHKCSKSQMVDMRIRNTDIATTKQDLQNLPTLIVYRCKSQLLESTQNLHLHETK